jgi:hypothetical protein
MACGRYYVPWDVAEIAVASNEEALFHPEAVVWEQEQEQECM